MVNAAPARVLRTTVAAPTTSGIETCRDDMALLWAAEDAAEAIAAVATVYSEPNLEVATPAPLWARVIASPPALVMTVTA